MPWIKTHIPSRFSLGHEREPGEDRFFHIMPELQRSIEYHSETNAWPIRQINISRSTNDLRVDIIARDAQTYFMLLQALGPVKYYQFHLDSGISFTVDRQYKKLQAYFFKQLLTVQPEIGQICDDLDISLYSSCSFDDLQQWYKNINIVNSYDDVRELKYSLISKNPISSIKVQVEKSGIMALRINILSLQNYETLLSKLGRRSFMSAMFFDKGTIEIKTRDRRLLAYVISQLRDYGNIPLKNLTEELCSDIRINTSRAYTEEEIAQQYQLIPSVRSVTNFIQMNAFVGPEIDPEADDDHDGAHIYCWMRLRSWLESERDLQRIPQVRAPRVSFASPVSRPAITVIVINLPAQQPVIAPAPLPTLPSPQAIQKEEQRSKTLLRSFKKKHKTIHVTSAQELPKDDWLCPITGELMENPVNFPYCLNKHCFEESAIRQYINSTSYAKHPLSREKITENMIMPNAVIKAEIEAYKAVQAVGNVSRLKNAKCTVM